MVPPLQDPPLPASLVMIGASGAPASRIGTPPQPATAPRTEHGLPAAQEVKLSKPSPSALHEATLVPLHADWVESHTSGTQVSTRQYHDAGQSVADMHCTQAELEVSQTMPRELQSVFERQAVRQTLRTQCTLPDPQWLSTRHSMQTLFAVSQMLLGQSLLFLQVSTATHLFARQGCPAEQSESFAH
jgi:hypothetical protein